MKLIRRLARYILREEYAYYEARLTELIDDVDRLDYHLIDLEYFKDQANHKHAVLRDRRNKAPYSLPPATLSEVHIDPADDEWDYYNPGI